MSTAVGVKESLPTRIQRSRAKGSRLPPGTICCTRPGKHSNPFKVGIYFRKVTPDWYVWMHGDSPHFGDQAVRDLDHSLSLFEEYATARVKWDKYWLEPLRKAGFLACWCSLESKCHVDIIIRLLHETAAVQQET